jgi:hypothetical protein
MVPAVTCEYLLYLLLSEWLQPLTRQKARGLLPGSFTKGTDGHWLRSNLKTRLGVRLGSQEPRPGASSTETACTRTVNPATNIQARGFHIPRERHHHPLQWQDKTTPDETDSKSSSSQVKPVPHSTDSRNYLECHRPQCQGEHSGTDPNTMEASNQPLRIDRLKFGPTCHVNSFVYIEIISS